MSQIAPDVLLNEVPDFTSWDEAQSWIDDNVKASSNWCGQDVQIASLEWSDIEQLPDSSFGLYTSKNWRKFVLATFLADLVSYQTPGDQVNFDRLLFVMHAFPQGFRTWWIKYADEADALWRPAGYTGWYPMLDTMFATFQNSPEKLKSRMVVPNTAPQEAGPLVYIFNYSVAPNLKHTPLTRALMTRCAEDIAQQKPQGLACITVSEDGVRIAQRFGMTLSGYLNVEGTPEGVFVTKRP